MKWIPNEKGPVCTCGEDTRVYKHEEGFVLVCRHHPGEAAMYGLPSKKPTKWPDLNDEEMFNLVNQGIAEQNFDVNTVPEIAAFSSNGTVVLKPEKRVLN